MTQSYTTGSNIQPNSNLNVDPAFIEQRLREMREGLTEAVDREVARRRRECLPIHVADNGIIKDLQQTEPTSPKT